MIFTPVQLKHLPTETGLSAAFVTKGCCEVCESKHVCETGNLCACVGVRGVVKGELSVFMQSGLWGSCFNELIL